MVKENHLCETNHHISSSLSPFGIVVWDAAIVWARRQVQMVRNISIFGASISHVPTCSEKEKKRKTKNIHTFICLPFIQKNTLFFLVYKRRRRKNPLRYELEKIEL